MAEVVAGISLAASVIQLIDFADRLKCRIDEFSADVKDLPGVFAGVRARLHTVVASIKQIQKQLDAGQIELEFVEPLSLLIDECNKELKNLVLRIDAILPKSTSSTWQRRLLALKSLKHDKFIKSHLSLLDGHLLSLTLFLVTANHDLLLAGIPKTSIAINTTTTSAIQQGDADLGMDLPKTRNDQLTANMQQFLPSQALVLGTYAQVQDQLGAKPSLLYDVAQKQNCLFGIDVERNPWIPVHPKTSITEACCCLPKGHKKSKQWDIISGLHMFTKSSSQHREDCPHHNRHSQTREYGMKLSQTSKLINRVVYITFSMTYGAGGLSLSPALSLKGIIRPESPAFQLLDEYSDLWVRSRGLDDVWAPSFQQIINRLRILFANGDATPYELDKDGNTILQYAQLCLSSRAGSTMQQLMVESDLWRFYKTLIAFGIPLNDAHAGQGTFLLHLIQHSTIHDSCAIDSLRELVDLGCEAEMPFPKPYMIFSRFCYGYTALMMRIPELAEWCGCDSLSLAVLSRSQARVSRAVCSNAGKINHQNHFGQSALHLASYWPWAVQTLLEAGASVSCVDRVNQYPLSYAIFSHNLESMRLLLHAGSPLSNPHAYESVLRQASQIGSLPMFELVATTVADRRKDIVLYAKHILPRHKVNFLDGYDVKKTLCLRELEQVAEELVAVDPSFNVHMACLAEVYHCPFLTADMANILYTLGFTDVSEVDRNGMTPLALSCIDFKDKQSMMSWLVQHGADFRKQIPHVNPHDPNRKLCSKRTAAHILGMKFGKELEWYMIAGVELLEKRNLLAESITKILNEKIRTVTDDCSCYCSDQGCSPLDMLIKGDHNCPQSTKFCNWFSFAAGDFIFDVLKADASTKYCLGTKIIRQLLFKRFELSHTCCNGSPRFNIIKPPMKDEDVREIVSEEREMIEEFLKLYAKADVEWKNSSESLEDFYTRFMSENLIEAPDSDVDDEYVQAVEAVGVKVDRLSLKRKPFSDNERIVLPDDEGF